MYRATLLFIFALCLNAFAYADGGAKFNLQNGTVGDFNSAINSILNTDPTDTTINYNVPPPVSTKIGDCGSFPSLSSTPSLPGQSGSSTDTVVAAIQYLTCVTQVYLVGANGATVNLENNLNLTAAKFTNQLAVTLLTIGEYLIFNFNQAFATATNINNAYNAISLDNLAAFNSGIRVYLNTVSKLDPFSDPTTAKGVIASITPDIVNIINELFPVINQGSADYANLGNITTFLSYSPRVPSVLAIDNTARPQHQDDIVTVTVGVSKNPNFTSSKLTLNQTTYDSVTGGLLAFDDYNDYNFNRKSILTYKDIFLGNIVQILQQRVSDGQHDPLAYVEQKMATEGMSSDYITKVNQASTPTVNLEILKSLNKVVYFLYQLHLDNQRLEIVQSVNSLSSMGLGTITASGKVRNIDQKTLDLYCQVNSGDTTNCPSATGQ
jgi:hypothetical protein